MISQTRYDRIRKLVQALNKKRKKQSLQIDMLCNNILTSQRDFINSIHGFSFAAEFFESLVGASDEQSLLAIANTVIQKQIAPANLAFFLRQHDSFCCHSFASDLDIEIDDISKLFDDSVVSNICRSNKVCNFEQLLQMGLQCNPSVAKKLSLAAVPLGLDGGIFGFILITRPIEDKISDSLISHIKLIVGGFSGAIMKFNDYAELID